MAKNQELTKARMSRGQLKTSCGKALEALNDYLKDLEKDDPKDITTAQLGTLEVKEKKGRQAVEKYNDSVVKCLILEDIPEEEQEDDEHVVHVSEYEDGLDEIECRIGALRAQVQEEKILAKAREAAGGGTTQTGNTGRVQAKAPPPLPKELSLDDLEVWRSTWRDYYSVTKLEKEPAATQRANLKSHLSQGMRGILEHAIKIKEDTTLSCEEILDEIKKHIRLNRNIQLDKVAFEKRGQKQGESFDDFLVAIRKMARNADLCEHCLDDRLLTRIMSGVNDTEVREELMAKVPTPKLEEAINFARSKEAAKRSNRDLCTRNVQQIHSHSRARDRSKSNNRQGPKQPHMQCHFCTSDRCDGKVPEKCPALGKKCNKCNKMDHFAHTTACSRGYDRRRVKHSQTRKGRAVQVRGLHGSKRAPKALVNILTEDGKNQMGSICAYPDSAADCTIMGVHVLEQLGVDPSDLEAPDEEGIDAARSDGSTPS